MVRQCGRGRDICHMTRFVTLGIYGVVRHLQSMVGMLNTVSMMLMFINPHSVVIGWVAVDLVIIKNVGVSGRYLDLV